MTTLKEGVREWLTPRLRARGIAVGHFAPSRFAQDDKG